MINVLSEVLQRGNEADARNGFGVFETLLIVEQPLLGKHIGDLATCFLRWGGVKEYSSELRVMAINWLTLVIK